MARELSGAFASGGVASTDPVAIPSTGAVVAEDGQLQHRLRLGKDMNLPDLIPTTFMSCVVNSYISKDNHITRNHRRTLALELWYPPEEVDKAGPETPQKPQRPAPAAEEKHAEGSGGDSGDGGDDDASAATEDASRFKFTHLLAATLMRSGRTRAYVEETQEFEEVSASMRWAVRRQCS